MMDGIYVESISNTKYRIEEYRFIYNKIVQLLSNINKAEKKMVHTVPIS